jgi:hypothetical protein
VGYAEPLPNHWGKTLPVLLIFVVLAVAWHAFQAPAPARRQFTQKDIITTLLAQLRQPDRRETSAEAPAMWVQIQNSNSITNVNNLFSPQDICITEEGGTVVLVKAEQGRLLLRYTPLNQPAGTACPNGTMFFLPKEIQQ